MGTTDLSDDVMEALSCHCTDPTKWAGSLCDQGNLVGLISGAFYCYCLPTFYKSVKDCQRMVLNFVYISVKYRFRIHKTLEINIFLSAICKNGCVHGTCNLPGECK